MEEAVEVTTLNTRKRSPWRESQCYWYWQRYPKMMPFWGSNFSSTCWISHMQKRTV